MCMAQTGNPVVDAPALQQAIQNKDAQKILDYVNANLPDGKKFATYKTMLDSLNPKNFIAGLLDTSNIGNLQDVKASFITTAKALEPQGGNFEGNVINATASFIAERFKQEMEIAFIDKFRELINGNTQAGKILHALLPVTATVLTQNDPAQYTTFLETLKEALTKDINNLPLNINVFLRADPFSLGIKPYYYPALLLYGNSLEIVGGKSVVLALNTINTDNLISSNKLQEPYNSIMRTLGVISRTLTNPETTTPQWLSVDKLKIILNNPAMLKIFFGLLLLKEEDELKYIKPVVAATDLYNSIISLADDKLQTLFSKLLQIDVALQNVYGKVKSIADLLKLNIPVSGDLVNDFEGTLINSLQAMPDFLNIAFNITIDPNVTAVITEIITSLNSLVSIKSDLQDKNYGLAFTQAITVISVFITDRTTLNTIKKYGNFAVSVTTSKDQNEMLQALRTAALPVGSYRIKRNAYESFSLNAYAGLFGGWQKFSSSVPAGVKGENTLLGFTAPIGIAYSWSGKKPGGDWRGSSNTIFISALDLGAVTSYRLTHDSTQALPDISFKNLIAPAAYYVYGFKKLPLSAGLGVQYGPELRSIKDNSPTILPSAWSIRLFLAIDIPFFNFYSRTEERKNK